MKIKKSALAAVVLASIVLVGFVGCQQNEKKAPVTATLSIENFALDIDPAEVNYIDIKFSSPMDNNYGGYTYWDDSEQIITGAKLMNSSVWRIYVDLNYGQSYKFCLNYREQDDKYQWRDIYGTYLQETPIEFSTRESPSHPTKHSITLEDAVIEFSDNNENWPNSQQILLSLKHDLHHEVLKSGDEVEITYKVFSNYNIKNIRANIVDRSRSVNYWKILNNNEKDLVFVDSLEASVGEDKKYKEGKLTFKIDTDMATVVSLQLFADYGPNTDNPELANLGFATITH